jgi:hypothetical protein
MIYQNTVILQMNKPNTTFLYTICGIMENGTDDNIKNNIVKSMNKIPDVSIVNKLLANKETYDEYAKTKYDNIKYEYADWAILKYVEGCSWLIDEMELLIKNMVNSYETNISKEYVFELNPNNFLDKTYANMIILTHNTPLYLYISCLGFVNTELNVLWNELEYELPYDLIKNNMNKKGYILDLTHRFNDTNKEHEYTINIKTSKKRERNE